MSTQPHLGLPNLGTFKHVARHPQVDFTERSLRNWFHEGRIKGYRVAGQRQILIDLDEVLAHANRRRDYGPKARVIELAAQPVIVERGDR